MRIFIKNKFYLKNMSIKKNLLAVLFINSFCVLSFAQNSFVKVRGNQFYNNGKPYYFIGTNYWYGTLLGLEKDKKRGVERLRRELDFLKKNGVTNLRLMAGAEGSGLLSGVTRVGPPLQPEQGKFDAKVLDGLDLILSEMNKRDMKAVIFLAITGNGAAGFSSI